MLYSRYANPLPLLDILIDNGDFYAWIIEFVNAENDRQLLEIWLHKFVDQTFADFKNSINSDDDLPNQIQNEDIKETIQSSQKILKNFIPDDYRG